MFLPVIGMAEVHQYQVESGCVTVKEREYTLLRSFMQNKEHFYLAVDNTTLQTKRFKTYEKKVECSESSYSRLKQKALTNRKTIQNAGITAGSSQGFSVTVDLCPSSKSGYERPFFLELIKRRRGYPVTLSITGRWIEKHSQAFNELKSWSVEGGLNVTWMNHGYEHPYERHVAVEKNFINLPGVDADREITDLEKKLLEADLLPSIFYRYAGLVSTPQKVKRLVTHYGLIPVGSRAWLAKGEGIRNGSIVLLHGNKNEPQGIRRFISYETGPLPVVQLPQLLSKEN